MSVLNLLHTRKKYSDTDKGREREREGGGQEREREGERERERERENCLALDSLQRTMTRFACLGPVLVVYT